MCYVIDGLATFNIHMSKVETEHELDWNMTYDIASRHGPSPLLVTAKAPLSQGLSLSSSG